MHRRLCSRFNKRQWQSQTFRWLNERPIEYSFLFAAVYRTCPQTILDVGTGKTALPALLRACGPQVTAIDNVNDYWPRGMFNPHYYVLNQDVTEQGLTDRYDLISCISVLEHITEHERAVRSMFCLLKPGGHLVLTFPYNEHRYIPDVYRLPGAGYGQDFAYVGQVFSRAEVNRWLLDCKATIVEQEYWRFFSGEYWTFGDRVVPPRRVRRDKLHQLTCLLFQKSI